MRFVCSPPSTSTSRLSATRKVLQRYLNRYESEAYSGSFDYTNSLNRSQTLIDPALTSMIPPRSESESAILSSRHSSGSIPEADSPKPKQTPSPQFSAVAQEDENSFDDVGDIDVHSIYKIQSKRKCSGAPCPPMVSQGTEEVAVLNDEAAVKPMELKLMESKPMESKPVESNPIELKLAELKPVESKPVESKPAESIDCKPFSRRRARAHAPAISQMNSIFSPPSIPPPPPPPAMMTKPVQVSQSAGLVQAESVHSEHLDDDQPTQSPQPPQPTQPTQSKQTTQPAQLEFPLDAEMTDPPKLPQYATGRRNAL